MLAICGNAYSQTLSATVYDDVTKKPIAEANIYLDGTSIHTTTNSRGQFTLNVEKQINTSLIISHIAYDLESIAEPFKKLPAKIYLKEKTNVLSEAVVFSTFTRKQLLKAFNEQFLGLDKAGKACKILNEEDVVLKYDYESNTLTASAKSPIIVENNYLGYKVFFNLITLYITYHKKTLDNEWIKQTAYYGTSSFIDQKPDDKRSLKRRKEVYEVSAVSFFKDLTTNMLTESKWRLFNRSYQVDPKHYFIIKDTLSLKLLQIDPESNINKFVPGFDVAGKVSVLYNKNLQSEIIFLMDSYYIDEYGNISDIDKLFYVGFLGNVRLGNMLPLNYEPEE